MFLGGNAALYNCTIADNTANYSGVYLDETAVLNAYNTIIVGNRATYAGDSDVDGSGSVLNAYNTLSSFTGWTSGSGNKTYDKSKPLFTNVAAKDYTLAQNSQAIDQGNDQYVTTTIDRAGKPRQSGERVDIGAYE